jgi:hypothetical protein
MKSDVAATNKGEIGPDCMVLLHAIIVRSLNAVSGFLAALFIMLIFIK